MKYRLGLTTIIHPCPQTGLQPTLWQLTSGLPEGHILSDAWCAIGSSALHECASAPGWPGPRGRTQAQVSSEFSPLYSRLKTKQKKNHMAIWQDIPHRFTRKTPEASVDSAEITHWYQWKQAALIITLQLCSGENRPLWVSNWLLKKLWSALSSSCCWQCGFLLVSAMISDFR